MYFLGEVGFYVEAVGRMPELFLLLNEQCPLLQRLQRLKAAVEAS